MSRSRTGRSDYGGQAAPGLGPARAAASQAFLHNTTTWQSRANQTWCRWMESMLEKSEVKMEHKSMGDNVVHTRPRVAPSEKI